MGRINARCVHTSSPVSETVLNSVPRELAGVGRDEDKVTLQARIDDLDSDILVGETNDKAVLGCVAIMDVNNMINLGHGCNTYYLFFA